MTGNSVKNSTETAGSPSSTGVPIHFREIRHSFVQGQTVVDAVDDVSLDVGGGSFLSLIGPSGCGKTTLLNMAAGLVKPTHGAVSLDQEVVSGPSTHVSYMLARDALMPWRSVLGNVLVGLETRRTPRDEARERAREWLARVGLGDFEDSNIWQLSQGMRQRVALARTLALEPGCILMDEPFAAVDAQTRSVLQVEFLNLWDRLGSTVMFVTHDIVECVLLSDRVVLMSSRPGSLLLDLSIELARPRSLEKLRGSPDFLEYIKQISKAMEEDRVRANFRASVRMAVESPGSRP